jgi:single-strand DNA-binding protein
MIQSSIYGRMGKDPKPGTTKTGTAMCTASIAIDVGREPGTETLWVSVMCFGPLAEALGQHQAGDMVAAIGKLTRSRYTGQDGQERESWSLLADALHSSRTVRPGRRRQDGESAEGNRARHQGKGSTSNRGGLRGLDSGRADDGMLFDDPLGF